MYQFIPLTTAASPTPMATAPTPSSAQPTGGQAIVNNVLVHVPTEAVTLATTMSPLVTVNGVSDVRVAWAVFIGAAITTWLVRYLNDATRWVWITTTIAFFLWMALVPEGALALTFEWVKSNTRLVLAVAAIASGLITVAGASGKIK